MQENGNNLITKNLIEIIKTSRNKAFQKVNEVLIDMYWKIGMRLSKIAEIVSFGDNYIDNISKDIL